MPRCAYGHVLSWLPAFGRGPLRPPRHGRRGRLPARRLVADERRLRTGHPRLVGAWQQRHAGQLAPASTTRTRPGSAGVFAGSALSFGGNDMVRIPDSTSLEPANVTVAAWIRGTSSPGQSKYVVGKGANGLRERLVRALHLRQRRPGLLHRRRVAELRALARGARPRSGTASGTTPRAPSTARRCASSSTASGRLGHALPSTPIVYNPPDGGGVIGDYGGTCDLFFVGDVDGVQIWSRALPVADIWRFLKALFSTSR